MRTATTLTARSLVLLSLSLSACFSPESTPLFSGSVSAGTGSMTAGSGGSDSMGGRVEGPDGGRAPAPPASSGGGTGGSLGCGGGTGGGKPGLGSSGEEADAGAGNVSAPGVSGCAELGETAVAGTDSHCYRVNLQELTFEAAARACAESGGQLASVGAAEENEHLWQLHSGEHWLGATDGRAPEDTESGPFKWLSGEPWGFTDWTSGQPNAIKTTCADGSAECHEHCIFQWSGDHGGDWNDRACWHQIASICEWAMPTDRR